MGLLALKIHLVFKVQGVLIAPLVLAMEFWLKQATSCLSSMAAVLAFVQLGRDL